MKKFVSVLLVVVLMMAMASSALADIVAYGFTVNVGQGNQVRTPFGLKSGETLSTASVKLASDPQVSSTTRLYFRMVAMNGSDASSSSYFERVGTKSRTYYTSYGIQGDGYKVGFWKQSASDPDHVISGRFTP